MQTLEVPLSKIRIIENHRTKVQDTNIHELMESIKQHGLKQPVGITKEKDGKHTLIFGNRRFLAYQKLGWLKIPATITDDVDQKKLLILNLTENIQRNDPSLAEIGRCIEKLISMGLSIKEVSSRLGVPEHRVNKYLKVYQCFPKRHRNKVKFMERGEVRKEGTIPADLAVRIATIKKIYGLKDDHLDRLIEHVQKFNTQNVEMDYLAKFLKSGLDFDEALKKMEHYHFYAIDVMAHKGLVRKMMDEHRCTETSDFFRKIIYGVIPPIKKPDFINLGE